VLQGLDLAVRRSEVVALPGPGGSPKCKLLRYINHLESGDDGEIRVAGRSLGFAENRRTLSARGRDGARARRRQHRVSAIQPVRASGCRAEHRGALALGAWSRQKEAARAYRHSNTR